MKVLLIGSTGTVGSAVADALNERHTVVGVSRSSETQVDLTDSASIGRMYRNVGQVDAVVCAAGGAPFVPLGEATGEHFAQGFANKLGGQINLVLHGLDYITDGGSFTLITGILASAPVRAGSISATANGGLHSFVTSAAAELPRGLRINAVSPNVVEESLPKYGTFFPGFRPVPVAQVAEAFVRSVEGVETGKNFRVGY